MIKLNVLADEIQAGPQLSVVVPTFNEATNIAELVNRLDVILQGIRWEVIFVDDNSPDYTARIARALAQKDRRIRVIHRVGRRGLSTACIEGMLASSAPYLAIMDGDLQHDEKLLPQMYHTLESKENLDIVVGSRYVDGGSLGDWNQGRAQISRFATWISRSVIKSNLKDPMSGFFMLRREVITDSVDKLSGIGFKILLDIFASVSRDLQFKEIGYTFGVRHSGESKLDSLVAWEYIMLLLDKTIGQYIPVRFIPFALVGCVGVAVHMSALWVTFIAFGTSFIMGQIVATLVAMTINFFLNNFLTYRDLRLRGWGLLTGWLSFSLACSIGAISNVGISTYLFQENTTGWFSSALAGIIIGAVWNYAVTSVYTWNQKS